MNLISKTYWAGAPMNFRREPENAVCRSLLLRAPDRREHRGLLWLPRDNPKPQTGVVLMHPRADFSHHYAIPRLLAAGMACLGASTRNPNNDTTTVHEEIILDVASSISYLKGVVGCSHVVLLGNSGGGSLNGFYQAEARKPKGTRIARTPAGRPTRLNDVEMPTADGLIYLSAHKGEGAIMNEIIDPAVVDESQPLLSDPEFDMYDERNGFVTPTDFERPGPWITYDDAFVKRFRAAQLERVRRIDAMARTLLEENRRALDLRSDPDFGKLSANRQRDILRREAFEPVLTIYRTMANLHYVDRHLDPSGRDYGSIFSPWPHLMNFKFFGFGRYATPEAWLSTWSGLTSNANLLKNLPLIEEPSLLINAGKDQEIYPETDAKPMFAAMASADKTFHELPEARHYFEPPFGEREAGDVERVMDIVVPWIEERFGQ